MDFLNNINLLTQRIAEEFNSVNGKLGNLSLLTTTEKTSLVASLNEVKSDLDDLENFSLINDALNSSTNYVWSISKIKVYVDSIIDSLFTNVPVEHDSLKKISDHLLLITTELTNKVSYDKDDLKSDAQKLQARQNIDSPSTADLFLTQTELTDLKMELGNLNRDFEQDFTNELI